MGHSPDNDGVVGTFFRRPTDIYSLIALKHGIIQVDHETGAITNRYGKRVEQVRPDGSGRVRVQRHPRDVWAPAHRIVWIAVFGDIPEHCYPQHRNGHRWDNRPSNLELTRRRGCITYPPEVSRDPCRTPG